MRDFLKETTMRTLLLIVGLLITLPGRSAEAAWAGTLQDDAQVFYGAYSYSTQGVLAFDQFITNPSPAADEGVHIAQGAKFNRLDLYWARGLSRSLQISLALPLLSNAVENIDAGPCNNDGGSFCNTTSGIGDLFVELRHHLFKADSIDIVVAGDLGIGAWNADTVTRYTNISEGTTSIGVSIIAGAKWKRARATTALRFTQPVLGLSDSSFGKVPYGVAQGSFQLGVSLPHGFGIEGSIQYSDRMGGGGFQEVVRNDWQGARFAALDFTDLSVGAQVSYSFLKSYTAGLSLRRAIGAKNGPVDFTAVTASVSMYLDGVK